jgi:hypothetical protein
VIGTLLELFWACVKIGCLAFGGGNAAIPLLEAAAVPRWVSQSSASWSASILPFRGSVSSSWRAWSASAPLGYPGCWWLSLD